MQNGGGGGIPMEELQRQQQGLTDPEGQGLFYEIDCSISPKLFWSRPNCFWTRSKCFGHGSKI